MQVVNTLKSSTDELQLWLNLFSKMYVPNISGTFCSSRKGHLTTTHSFHLGPIMYAHPCYEALNREGNNSLKTLRKGRYFDRWLFLFNS